jgi:hypothetical protein
MEVRQVAVSVLWRGPSSNDIISRSSSVLQVDMVKAKGRKRILVPEGPTAGTCIYGGAWKAEKNTHRLR